MKWSNGAGDVFAEEIPADITSRATVHSRLRGTVGAAIGSCLP